MHSCYIFDILFLDTFSGVIERSRKRFFKLIRQIPAVQKKIDDKMSKIHAELEGEVIKRTKDLEYYTKLPYDAFTHDQILEMIDQYLKIGNYNWKGGRVSGAVYNYDDDLAKLVGEVYRKTSYTNPLHPDIFPGINKMEAEIVRMTAVLFHGDDDTVGTVRIYIIVGRSLY